MDCPACRFTETFEIKRVDEFMIRKCVACWLEFCSPMPSPNQLERCYSSFEDHVSNEKTMLLNAQRNLVHLVKQHGLSTADRVLDFGCGKNVFIRHAMEQGFTGAFGFDKYCGKPGDSAGVNDISGPWEWITAWGVLEHLTDPYGTLVSLRARLALGGRLALTTVHIEGPIPFRYRPPLHTCYWTQAAIAVLAARAGFTIMEYRPYEMMIDSDNYLDILTRTVPSSLRSKITHALADYVEVPTNEVFVVMRKTDNAEDDHLV